MGANGRRGRGDRPGGGARLTAGRAAGNKGAIGDDMKRALGRETDLQREQKATREAGRADAMLLFNRTRRAIFEHAFGHPCSSLNQLAAAAKVSPATAKYHLDLMVDGGLLGQWRRGKSRLFYPAGLVDENELELLATIRNPLVDEVRQVVRSKPGIVQKDVAEHLGRSHQSVIRSASALIAAGLVKGIREGRHVRYFPVERSGGAGRSSRRRMKGFREGLLTTLRRNGFRTRVHRASDRELVVSMEAGDEKVILSLITGDPFGTAAI